MFKKLLFLSILISINVKIQSMIKFGSEDFFVVNTNYLINKLAQKKYQMTHITEKNCPNLWYTFNKRKNEGRYDPTEYINEFNNAKNKNEILNAILKMNIFIYRSARMGNKLKCLRMLLEIRNKAKFVDITEQKLNSLDKKARIDAKSVDNIIR